MADRRKKTVNKMRDYMRGRLLLIIIAVLVVMCVLTGRLVYINNTNGDKYAKRVLSQQSYVSSTLPYKRGTIYDRNGIVLAESTKVYNIILDPKVVLTYDYYREPTVTALHEVFGFEIEEIETILEDKKDSSYVVLRRQEGYDTVASFREKMASNKFVRGVWFEEEYLRYYPGGSLASHVIGFTNSGNVGSNGIEQYYNDMLNGSDGMEYGYYDSELNMQSVVREAQDGYNVVSTIDYNIQNILERHVDEFTQNIGSKNIGAIIMNPNNGEILAMASNEEYDLNSPRDLSAFYTSEELEAMTSEEKMDKLYALWRNFCVSDTYEPGSTFKTITVSSALEEGLVSSSSSFECKGYEQIDVWKISCNNKSGHGILSLTEALTKSCNCALMNIAERLGRDSFFSYENNFGFGRKTGIDLVGEADGIIIPKKNLNVTELATSSFGTTFNVTMVQMAAAYASVINGGSYYRPHVVSEVVSSEGAVIESYDNELQRETVSTRTSEFIRQALYMTVEEGTATPAKVDGYIVGGKTGTAQKKPREDKKYLVSFVGFAPANDPQIMIYVVMDEIQDETVAGSSSPASSMTGSLLEEILPYIGVYPEGEIKYNVNLELLLDDDPVIIDDDDSDGDGQGEPLTVRYDPKEDEKNPDVLPDGIDDDIDLGDEPDNEPADEPDSGSDDV